MRGDVEISLRPDGSGVVSASLTLDTDAVHRLERYGGKPVEQQVLVLDLLGAGWRSDGWKRSRGSASLRLSHAFTDPAQADELVAQIVGTSGIVRDVVVERERGRLESRDHVAATADLTKLNAGSTSDAAVRSRLHAVGVDPNAVELLLTKDLRDALTLHVTVIADGHRDTVTVRPGHASTASATSASTSWGHVLTYGVAAVLALLGIAVLGTAGVSAFRAQRVSRRRRAESAEPRR